MSHTARIARSLSLFGLLCALGAVVPGSSSSAQGGLRAQVFILQGALPRLPTQQALLGYARRHNARRVNEVTEAPIEQRHWQGNIVTKFSRPLGDVQFEILFYDVHDAQRRLVGTPMEVFVSNRNESVFVQRFQLARPAFRPNRRMEMVVTVRRNEAGRQRFELVGEEVRRSGIVDFTREGT